MVKKNFHYKNQNYSDLKKHHQEVETLFSDPLFPPVDSVLGNTNIPQNVVWKRPGEICEMPKLFIDNNLAKKTYLVRAGEVSCNWMVSACAILGDLNELRNKVIPDYWEQEWDNKYCGIFHFKIWRFGRWNDVVIDDFLPTVDNILLTTQSVLDNEFWPALIEKAYVKLHGSYEALKELELSDALVDFTGGVSELIDITVERFCEIEEKRSQLFEMLRREVDDHSIICFTLNTERGNGFGTRSELGLVTGHSYHVTDVRKAYIAETTLKNLFNGREKIAMVRLKDPRDEEKKLPGSPDSALSAECDSYAYSTEVLTKFRSRNKEWSRMNDSERKKLGLSIRNSSEFWMPLDDIVWGFGECIIIRLVTENPFVVPGQKWKGSVAQGRWQTGPNNGVFDRSGGGDIRQDSFLKNPQYLMTIPREMELLLQLLQFHDEERGDGSQCINLLIGIHTIRVEENRRTRLHKIWPHTTVVITEDHRRKREVTFRGWLYPGRYIIIPSTYRSGDSLSFIMRAFSKKEQIQIRELNEETPIRFNPCSCLFPDFEWATIIIVDSAEITNKYFSKINSYCSIQCEGKKIKTDTAKDDMRPVWNVSYIFYRKKTFKPMILKVWNHNKIFPDSLIGECELPAGITHNPTPLDAVLLYKETKNSEPVPVGTIHLTILTEDNLMAI